MDKNSMMRNAVLEVVLAILLQALVLAPGRKKAVRETPAPPRFPGL